MPDAVAYGLLPGPETRDGAGPRRHGGMTTSSTVLEHISALLAKNATAAPSRRPSAGDGGVAVLSMMGASAYGSLNALLSMIGSHCTRAGAQVLEVNIGAGGWADRLSRVLGSLNVRVGLS